MDPYQSMTFDNRPRVAQFIDGGPITDGMANLAASLFQAPLAAAQIRRQREADQLGQLWRQKEFDRQSAQDQIARLWHEQAMLRQTDQDERAAELQRAQIENLRADNTRQTVGMLGTGLNNAAARGIDAVKAIGGLFKGGGRSPAGGAQRQPKIEWVEGEDGSKRPYVMGEDGQLHEVPIAGMPVAGDEQPQPQGDPGWPLAAVAGAGALGAGGAYALAKRGATKAAAPAAAATASRLGTLFARVPGGATVARALPVAGRVAGALASAPVAIAATGATVAYQGNKATRADLNPMDAPALDVIKAYAEGKNLDPGIATKFGKAVTTLPFGLSGERYSEAIDRIQGQHVDELTQALATAIPEGDPNKARILEKVRMYAWQNPQRAQEIVAGVYQALMARDAQMQNQGAPASVPITE